MSWCKKERWQGKSMNSAIEHTLAQHEERWHGASMNTAIEHNLAQMKTAGMANEGTMRLKTERREMESRALARELGMLIAWS
eukprot:4161049-Amphidinium_carterae.1